MFSQIFYFFTYSGAASCYEFGFTIISLTHDNESPLPSHAYESGTFFYTILSW